MPTVAIWIFGLLASLIVGAMIGAWMFEAEVGPPLGEMWGILVGGYVFVFLWLWS